MKYSFPFDLSKISSDLKAIPADPKKVRKFLPLILCLLLVIILVCCSGGDTSDGEILQCIVKTNNLAVYKKADTGSRIQGLLPADLEIEVCEQLTINETTWGRIDDTNLPDGTKVKAGWIDLRDVRFPGDPEEIEPAPEPTDAVLEEAPSVTINMGTITASKLNIRSDVTSKSEAVGAYYKGDRVEILETKTHDDTRWGRTNLGWISMGYVRMDGTVTPESPDATAPSVDLISNGNTEVLGYGVVNLGELNVRTGPGTDYEKVCTVAQGVRYAYYQASTVSGSWVRIEDGWVSTEYFYLEGTVAEGAASVTVTTEELNIRTGPNTSFRSCGTYAMGETIEVMAQVGAWGYTDRGWVFMAYTEPVEPTYTTGICTVLSGLNIRQEPNADSEIVGTYTEGDRITITEVDGHWGKTVQGWINLKFVEFDK